MDASSSVVRVAPDLAGQPHDHRSGRHHEVFRNQRAGSHDRPCADAAAVQQNRAHPDQAPILDGAAMHDRAVSDRHIVADDGWMGITHDMDEGEVLNIGARADADGVDVASHDHVHPHAALWPEMHVTDDLSAAVHEGRRVDSRIDRTVGAEHTL